MEMKKSGRGYIHIVVVALPLLMGCLALLSDRLGNSSNVDRTSFFALLAIYSAYFAAAWGLGLGCYWTFNLFRSRGK